MACPRGGAVLLFELVGASAPHVAEQLAAVRAASAAAGAIEWEAAPDAASSAALWQARKEALWATMEAAPGKEVMITDVCVPVSKLAAALAAAKRDLDASPLTGPLVAHAGDGNFHAFICFDPEAPTEVSAPPEPGVTFI